MNFGIQGSPRTVQKYLLEDPNCGRRQTVPSQHWTTFVRNHAKAMLACDFFVSVTVRFRFVYVFLIMAVGTRRLIHFDITSHRKATWTFQQFREGIDNSLTTVNTIAF
ncbi:MAG: hypothetical protein DMG05_17225 [Acidobacteria bacterium]|nr:MAG: hypothetical protein DMG05_17225 [Acidobacteriota bacterium]